MTDLRKVVTTAYREMVIERSKPVAALSMFHQNRDQFLVEAKMRIDQLQRVKRQCFISSHEIEFLQHAIDSPVPSPVTLPTTPDQPEIPGEQPEEEEEMTSKLSGLPGLFKSIVADVEGEAENALKELQEAKEKAIGGVGVIKGVAADIKKSAADMHDFANQITNGGPPLDQ